jgi:two-component system, LytTR family, sensor kinase
MASIISNKNFRISLSFVVFLIMAIQLIWLISSGIPYKTSIVVLLLIGVCFAVSFLLIGNNLNYYRPQKFSMGFLVGWCLFFAWFCTIIPKTAIGFLNFQNNSIHEFLNNNFYINYIFSALILACYSALCLIWYHNSETQENEIRKQEAFNLNREAELYKLRQQLQPHFLFNSLNSINALIGSKPMEARKMIQQLSDFLRFTIKKEENQIVNLEDELEHLSLYLEIEKVRFGHRLVTKIDCSEDSKSLKIPALLLQPIVENAIKFGLYDTIEDVEIEIIAQIINNDLHIEIKNPFDSATSVNAKGTGFGLSSVRKRLLLLFNRTDLLTTSKTDNIFITKITIPQPNVTSVNN